MNKGKGHAVQVKPARKSTAWWRGEHQRKSKKTRETEKALLSSGQCLKENRQKRKKKKQCHVFLSQDSEKQANPEEPHVFLDYARGHEFWKGNIHYLIKRLIILPIALAWLKVSPPY